MKECNIWAIKNWKLFLHQNGLGSSTSSLRRFEILLGRSRKEKGVPNFRITKIGRKSRWIILSTVLDIQSYPRNLQSGMDLNNWYHLLGMMNTHKNLHIFTNGCPSICQHHQNMWVNQWFRHFHGFRWPFSIANCNRPYQRQRPLTFASQAPSFPPLQWSVPCTARDDLTAVLGSVPESGRNYGITA